MAVCYSIETMYWKKNRIKYVSRFITNYVLEMSVGERLLIISERDHSKNFRSIAYSRLVSKRIRSKFKNVKLMEYTAPHTHGAYRINEPSESVWDTVFGNDFKVTLPSNAYQTIMHGHLGTRLQSLMYRAASAHDRRYDIILHLGSSNLEASLLQTLFTTVQGGRLVSIDNMTLFSETKTSHLDLLERKIQYLTSNIINASQTIITNANGTNLNLTCYRSTPHKSNLLTARTPGHIALFPTSYLTLTPSHINLNGKMEATLLNHDDVLLTLNITNNMLNSIQIRKNKKNRKHPSFKHFKQDPFLRDAHEMKYLKKPLFATLNILPTEPYEYLEYKKNRHDPLNIHTNLSLSITFKHELRSYTFKSKPVSIEISKNNKNPVNIILNTVN